MIQFEHVSKQYGSKRAVSDLSLEVPAGELFAFLGPNGAGKTTTIKMITGLLRSSSGRVLVAGHDMAGSSEEARRQISYVPDQPYLSMSQPPQELSGMGLTTDPALDIIYHVGRFVQRPEQADQR